MLYHDYRTERVIRDLLVFPCDDAPYECSYSPGYFARHSEHVTLQQSYYSNGSSTGLLRPYDAGVQS